MYSIGVVLSIPGPFWRHYMVVVGPNSVLHSSKETGVVRESLSDVITGKLVTNHKRWGNLSDLEIVGRATNMIGEPYNLLFNNCEHVVRRACGIKEESPQIVVFSTIACVVVGAVLFPRIRAA